MSAEPLTTESASNKTIQLFNAALQEQNEGLRALRSLRFAKFLRLGREGAALRRETFRLLRQSAELLQHVATTLVVATALSTQIGRESQL